MIGHVADGTRGFDANTRITYDSYRRFLADGYRYVLRYVRRDPVNSYDISKLELERVLNAGLGIMLVQHVDLPGWLPSGSLGTQYGATATDHAKAVGYANGATLWCDLEEVSRDSDRGAIIAYCNNWHDVVKNGGYSPGLYVGVGCGLSSKDLYYRLKFQRYWAAYNLNRDRYPAVRGIQLKQMPYPIPTNRVYGIRFQYDVDLVQRDAMGSSPVLMLPEAG